MRGTMGGTTTQEHPRATVVGAEQWRRRCAVLVERNAVLVARNAWLEAELKRGKLALQALENGYRLGAQILANKPGS